MAACPNVITPMTKFAHGFGISVQIIGIAWLEIKLSSEMAINLHKDFDLTLTLLLS